MEPEVIQQAGQVVQAVQAVAEVSEFKYIAIGLMAFAMFGAAIGVGNIFAALLNGIARNPSAEPKLAKYVLVGAAFAEGIGIFALALALLLIFK